jgi:hypothetical protein
MDDNKEIAPQLAKAEKFRNPYQVFLWGGLVMAALCFWLATQRLAIKRPARADAYFITGILGILSAAMAVGLGSAHERARRSQASLKDSVDKLQDSMRDMPRSLMEESVKVAAREAEGRRADQERQARELRAALEDGIRAGFAPLAPALSERIEASLSGLGESLRHDREERAASLRATGEIVGALQAAQAEWARASSSLLEKLRAQGETLHADMTGRDAAGRAAWEQLAASSAQGVQAALDTQMEKVRALTETLSGKLDGTLREILSGATATVQTVGAEAESRLRASAGQAEEWLRSLSGAAGAIGEALEAMRRGGEDSAGNQAALQAEWRATVEMFHQGMGGVLDRLQALGSYAQGQEALLQRMDETIRAFEARSADLIEDTAMKAQESLLDALDQAGARDAAAAEEKA